MKRVLHLTTLFLTALFLQSCSKEVSGKANFSEVYIGLLNEYGVRLQTTNATKRIEGEWTIKKDGFGFGAVCKNTSVTELVELTRGVLKNPGPPPEADAQSFLFKARDIGAAILIVSPPEAPNGQVEISCVKGVKINK